MSTGNEGEALILLAERRGDLKMARLAVQQIEAAFTTSRAGGDAPSAPNLKRSCRKPAPLPKNSPSAEGSTPRIDAALEAVDGALEEYRDANAAYFIAKAERLREKILAAKAK